MDQLARLTEEARKLALNRFRLVQPHLEDGRPLKLVAASAGIPFRTAQRWVSLYRQFGLAALARKKRTDNGEHREISAKLKEAIEGIALQKPPIPVAAICRQARRLAQDLGEEPPSYWVVYRIVSALPADLVTLAHEGCNEQDANQRDAKIQGLSPLLTNRSLNNSVGGSEAFPSRVLLDQLPRTKFNFALQGGQLLCATGTPIVALVQTSAMVFCDS